MGIIPLSYDYIIIYDYLYLCLNCHNQCAAVGIIILLFVYSIIYDYLYLCLDFKSGRRGGHHHIIVCLQHHI